MKKNLIPIALLVFGAFVGIRFLWTGQESSSPGPGSRGMQAVPVEVTEIGRETIRNAGRFTGTLKASSRFVISPKINGRLEMLHVNIGDRVENGEQIAVLDSQEYALAVSQAEAELAVARANLQEAESALEIASRELERTRELREQRIASEAELDSAKAGYNAAKASHAVSRAHIRQREAALEAARVRLSYTRIHARWENGGKPRVVSEKFIDEGNMLRANDPIVSIVDISTVILQIHVIEREFPIILPGQRVCASTDAYPGRHFEGRVLRRAPVLAEESRQAVVEIEIPNDDFLLAPGMYIRAEIGFEEVTDAIVVPASAVVRRNGEKGVFIADERALKASFVRVETGITQNGRREITYPEISGRVVTLGQHLLEDGAAIRIPETNPESFR